jgi:type VI secretion system protein ImpA
MINLEQFIKPIRDIQPTGTDLRQDASLDSLFYQAKDARQNARQIERRILLNPELDERANWKQVVQLCTEILLDHSKDIEVVTWLIEGLLRTDGLTGLGIGFQILATLIEQYWQNLYPAIDDVSDKVMAITSLNGEDYDGTLIQPLYQLPITRDLGQGQYVLWQYQQAMENESKYTDSNTIAAKREQGMVFLSDIHNAVAQSGSEFYQQLQQDLHSTKQAFEKLHDVLVEKCDSDAPPSSQIITALNEVGDHIRFLISEAPFELNDAITNPATEKPEVEKLYHTETEVVVSAEITTANDAEIANRKQALAYLQKIAVYFRKAEPQSPLPHLLDRAVRWGNMPFSELLKEIIKDDAVRASAYELMGLETTKTTNEVKI